MKMVTITFDILDVYIPKLFRFILEFEIISILIRKCGDKIEDFLGTDP